MGQEGQVVDVATAIQALECRTTQGRQSLQSIQATFCVSECNARNFSLVVGSEVQRRPLLKYF